MKRERLTRDDLNRLDSPRPTRKVYRDPPDLPVHFAGFTEPTPCGLPVDAWAARTNRRGLVTCPGCRPRIVVNLFESWSGGFPSPPPPPSTGLARLVGVR